MTTVYESFGGTLYFIFIGTLVFILGVLYAGVFNSFIEYWTSDDKVEKQEKHKIFSNGLLFTILLSIFFILIIYLLNGTDKITLSIK